MSHSLLSVTFYFMSCAFNADTLLYVTLTADTLLYVTLTADPRYSIPGGGCDPGEGLTHAALREVREETGIEVELTGILKIEYHAKGTPKRKNYFCSLTKKAQFFTF